MKKWMFLVVAILVCVLVFGHDIRMFQWTSPDRAIVLSSVLTTLLVASMDRSRYVWVSFLTLGLSVFLLLALLPREEIAFYYAAAGGQWMLLSFVLHRSLAGPRVKLIFSMLVPLILGPYLLHHTQWVAPTFIRSAIVLGNVLLALAPLILTLPERTPQEQGWSVLAIQQTLLRLCLVYVNLVLLNGPLRLTLSESLAWPLLIVAVGVFALSLFRGSSFWDRMTLSIHSLFTIVMTLTMGEHEMLMTMAFVVATSAFVVTPAYAAEGGGWNAILKPVETGGIGGITFVIAAECCLRMIENHFVWYGIAWLSLLTAVGVVIWWRAVGGVNFSKMIFEKEQLTEPRPLLHFLLLILAAVAAVGSSHV